MTNLVKNGMLVTVTDGAAGQFIKLGFKVLEKSPPTLGQSKTPPPIPPMPAIPTVRAAEDLPKELENYPKRIVDWTDGQVRKFIDEHNLNDGKNRIMHLRKIVKEYTKLEGPFMRMGGVEY